ncbi:DUF6056 family protein [Streptomyces sp. NPDC059176]|uniref:DUF6056 family protein n=1 Tax=unclassified Streptomyces TaxID=2593676 RepID=UPI003692BBFD
MFFGASTTTRNGAAGGRRGEPDAQDRHPGRGDRRPPRWPVLLATGLCAPPLALLLLAAWLGRHVRPGADEWCFLPFVRDHGVAGLIGRFYDTDNGRVGNGLLVGSYAQFPVAGHQWFAAVTGALVLVVLWALTRRLLRLVGLDVPRGAPLLVAATVTVVFLFATRNTYKTYYWPAASVSHTLPPVLACAAVLPALTARGPRGRTAALAVVAAAGAFLGTLSEETSVVALVVLSGLVMLARPLATGRARTHLRRWALVGAAGVATGTTVLLTSPGARHRRARYGADGASALGTDTLTAAARAFGRILETVLTTWQYGGALAVGLLLGILARSRGGPAPVPHRPLLLAVSVGAAFLVSGYLCTVITYPVFGTHVVSAERTWNDYLLLYVLLLVILGTSLGRALRRGPPWWRTAALAGAVVVAVSAVAGLASPLVRLGDDMRVRAERWDRQDRWLRAGASRGAHVLPYVRLPVSGMLEPFGDGGRRPWPARCVADYYHLDAVTRSELLP